MSVESSLPGAPARRRRKVEAPGEVYEQQHYQNSSEGKYLQTILLLMCKHPRQNLRNLKNMMKRPTRLAIYPLTKTKR